MSEFSDSYHLRTPNPADADALLVRAGVSGLVIPTGGPWITFVAAPEDENAILTHNTGLLLHYLFGEDHGCWVTVHDGPSRLARLAYMNLDDEDDLGLADYQPEDPTQDRGEALEILARLGLIEAAAETTLLTLDGQVPRDAWGSMVATALQLGSVSWLDWDGALVDKEYTGQRFPGAYFIDVP